MLEKITNINEISYSQYEEKTFLRYFNFAKVTFATQIELKQIQWIDVKSKHIKKVALVTFQQLYKAE